MFVATGVVPHFAVDVHALSADNLTRVQLLVILRDGLMRPQAEGQPDYVWMTHEQEQAVVDFVHRGGGFLNLHNSMGLSQRMARTCDWSAAATSGTGR